MARVRSHRAGLLESLGMSPGGRWSVHARIVVSNELFTPHIRKSPIPIVSVRELQGKLENGETPL